MSFRTKIMSAATVLLCSCSPALYQPTETDAQLANASLNYLAAGRTMYVKHCGSCHNLHLPEQFTQAQWEATLPEMQQKAKISDEETGLISDFILVRCKQE